MKKNALENEGIFSIVSSGNSVSHHRPMTRASFRLELLIASSRKIGFFKSGMAQDEQFRGNQLVLNLEHPPLGCYAFNNRCLFRFSYPRVLPTDRHILKISAESNVRAAAIAEL